MLTISNISKSCSVLNFYGAPPFPVLNKSSLIILFTCCCLVYQYVSWLVLPTIYSDGMITKDRIEVGYSNLVQTFTMK